jgi:hypothetical protein
MQPTPLRGPKIGAILKTGFVPTVFPIYHGGAADGHTVGWPLIKARRQRYPICAVHFAIL